MAKSKSTPAYYTGSRDRYEANRERIGKMIYEAGRKSSGYDLVPTQGGTAWTTPGARNAAKPVSAPTMAPLVQDIPVLEESTWDTAQYSLNEPPKHEPAHEKLLASISSDPMYNQYVEMGLNALQLHDLKAQENTKYLTPEATQAYYAVLGRDGAAAAKDFLGIFNAYTQAEQQRIAYDQQERERLARIAEENRKAYGLTGDEEAELLRLRDGSYFGADDPLYQQYVAMGLNAAQPTDLGALEQTEYLTPDAMQAYYAVLGRDGADAASAFLDAVKSGAHPDVAEMVADGERYRELRDRALSYGYQDEGDFGDRLARSFRLLPEDASGNAAEYLTENLSYGLGSSVEGALDFLAAGGANAAAQIGEWFGADTDAIREWAERVAINELADDRQGRQEYWGAGDAMSVAGDVASGIGGMLPTMALGALAAPAGMAYMGVSSAGQSMSDALSQGADINRAMVYGALSGVLSAATEKIVGGVPFLGGGVLDDTLRSLGGSSRMAGLFKTATDVLGEGAEEWLESAVSPYLERVHSEEQRGKSSTEIWNENEQERLYSFLVGSLTSAVLNGAASVSGRALSSGEQQQLRQEVEAAIAQNEADLSPQQTTPNADAPQAQIAQNGTGLSDVLPQQSANIPAARQTVLQSRTEAIWNEAVDLAIQQRAAELAQGAAQPGVDPVAAIDPATLPEDPLAPDSMTPEQFTESRVQAAAEWRAAQEPEYQQNQMQIAEREAQRATTQRATEAEIPSSYISSDTTGKSQEDAARVEEYLNSVDNGVKQFAEQYIEGDETKFKRARFSDVSERQASDIERLAGIDVSGYDNGINKNGIDHIKRRHGENGEADNTMADINDIARIPYILRTYDEANLVFDKNGDQVFSSAYMDKNNNPSPLIEFKKRVDGTVYVTEAVPDSEYKTLWVESAYINKKNKSLPRATDLPLGSPSSTSMTSHSAALISNPTITDEIENFKSGTTSAAVDGTGESADVYAELQQKHGTLPHGEIPTRDINVPSRDAQGGKVSLSARTIMESDAPDDFVSALKNEVVNGSFSYFESTNKDAIDSAKRRIREDGAVASLNAWERNFTGEPLKTGASLEERKNALRGVDKEDIALAIELYKSALAAEDYQLAQKLAVEIAAAGNQSGQVVQAMSLIKRMTSDGQLYYLQLVVDRMAKEVQARNPRRKFNISIDEGLQQNLLQAKGQEEIDAAVDAIKQNIADQVPATFLDKWNAWRYVSMLGNPKTHIRNTMGNGVMFSVQRIKNGIASGIEAGAQRAGLINERSTTVLGRSEVDNALRSFASGDYDVMADEVAGNKSHDYFNRATQDIMDRRTVFKSKVFRPVEKVRRLNSNLLEAEDKIFSKAHYTRALAQYLKANGWTAEQIQSGTNEANVALQKAREKAIQEAQRATFRDASETAKWLNGASKAADAALAAVMPFTKTPINVLKRGLEYSPVGLIRGIKNSIFDVRSGKVSATEAIDRMAAGLTGSGIVALGWLLGSLGVLTGGDDENDDVQKQKELTGYQNYSLHIGDVYYSLDWLSPISMPLFVGVSLSQSEDIGTALGSLTGPFLEMSMLQGLNSILQSAEYGPFDNKLANMAADAAASYVGQAIPTVFRQLASTVDGTRRDSYAVGDSKGFAKYIEQEANQLGSKIPFVASTLQPYVDAWGRTEESGSFLGRAVENFLSPGYVSRDNTTDVDRFLAELVDEVGDPSLFPNTASRSVTLKKDGDTMEYNADTWTEYSQIRGQAAYDAVNGLIQQPTFMMRLSPEEQAEAIKNAYEMANAIGKSGIDADVSKGWAQNKAVEAYDAGIELSDWILFNTMADGTGASNRAAALNGMGWLSNDERSTMFDIYLPDARYNPFGVAQDLSDRSAVSGSQFLNTYDSLFADGAPTQMDAFNELRSSDLSTVQLAEIWNEIGDMAVSDGGWPSDKNPFMMAYETGINRDDVLDIYGAFYGGRSQSQSRLLEELDDSGFTEAQKAAMWEVFAEAQGWKKTWADVS